MSSYHGSCPLQSVKRTCKTLVQSKIEHHISINQKMVEKLCQEIAVNTWNQMKEHTHGIENLVSNDGFLCTLFISWDEEGVHFRDLQDPEATAMFVLVLSSINFCFWPSEDNSDETKWIDYNDLASALKNQIVKDRKSFSSSRLVNLSEDEFVNWFGGRDVPLASERVRLIREVAEALITYFDGQAAELIKAAGQSASQLVKLVTAHFPGFRDHCIDKSGSQLFFYKRAQIFVADLWGAFRGKSLGEFTDLDELTMFADYQVPQVLRQEKILKYDDHLSKLIDTKQIIRGGSQEEIELRAFTIVAVEMIKEELELRHRIRCKSIEVDWLLWQRGENLKKSVIAPHHRTYTIYY